MKPNDKVVCVDDVFPHRHWKALPSAWPRRGVVYVVRRVDYIPPRGCWPEGWGVWLVGIVGDAHPITGIEVGFLASRFRLVSEIGHPPIAVKQETEVQG